MRVTREQCDYCYTYETGSNWVALACQAHGGPEGDLIVPKAGAPWPIKQVLLRMLRSERGRRILVIGGAS